VVEKLKALKAAVEQFGRKKKAKKSAKVDQEEPLQAIYHYVPGQ